MNGAYGGYGEWRFIDLNPQIFMFVGIMLTTLIGDNMMKDYPIIIVGGGLSGLYAASLLVSRGIECNVLEAQERIGGRVLSSEVADKPEIGRFDLGPTWFWPQHEPVITRLVGELGLKTNVQPADGAVLLEQSSNSPVQRRLLPEGAAPESVRIVGGMQSLVDTVAGTLPADTVKLNTRVTTIRKGEETIALEATVNGETKTFHASAVIMALPPRIVAQNITFTPSLTDEVMASLSDKPTWMAGQAKAVAIYDHPFWREDGLSGQAMSWAGPLQEIHDASPHTGYGALFGFFGVPTKIRQQLGEESVRDHVIHQLTHLFGDPARDPISFLYKDWASDPYTAVDADIEPLGAFPSYGLNVNLAEWKNKMAFAGTETSSGHGGHLEGALQSAERAVLEMMTF